jgi:Asp-tRNA(Asn)/Glu-tRNA(Gln) amidotransferase A subunit family amidase
MDCALVFNAIHGSDEKDPSTIPAPFRFDSDADLSALRIGYDESAPEAFVEALRELGADPSPMPEMPDVRIDSLGAESAAAFDDHVAPGGELPPMPEGLTEAEQRRMNRFRRGRDILAMDYIQSQRRRRILMQRTAEAMEGFDMFVSGSGQVRLTNDTGHPAVVLPYGFGDSNPDDEYAHEQPITTTIVGDLFADDKILAVAHAYQSATDWHTRRPPLG